MIALICTLFFGYIGFMILKLGMVESISDTFYHLPKKYGWVFSVWLWTISILLMYAGGTNLMFLAGMCIMFVGAWPWFNNDQKIQHYIAAVLGISLGMVSMWYDFGLWLIPILFIIFSLGLNVVKIRFRIFWIEILAFGAIIIGLIFR